MIRENKLNVFISGQKYFGELVLASFLKNRQINVMGVCCPLGDKYIGWLASINNIPIITAGMLNGDTMPDNIDVGVTAHSFDYIGKRVRYKAKLGWVGYHPSLLPRHRGRSAIEWAIKMRDFITGGTTFWLNSGIDRGNIIMREFAFIDPKLFAMDSKKAAKILWESELQDIGIRLLEKTFDEILSGKISGEPQDDRFSTFEPSADVKDIYKPDALMLLKNNI
jgi:methionyl-tRNA formyltransferase